MTSSKSAPRRNLAILGVCVGVFALGQFHRASGSVFSPILMDRFSISASMVGALVSTMFFATIAAQIPFGVALDRLGPRVVLSACVLAVAAGTTLFAFGSGFDALLISRVMIGVGLAAMGAATHVIIARNFAPADFGYISGLVVTLGGVGGLLGTYPLALALERSPWAVVFAGAAGATLALAAAVLFIVRPGAPPTANEEPAAPGGGYVSLLRQPEFRRILAMGAVSFAPITTVTGLWGGPYLQNVVGLSAEGAGAVLLALFGATIAAGYVFGLLDRAARSRRAVILTAAGVSSASLLLLGGSPDPGAAASVALLLAMVFCQQFYIPLGAHMRAAVPDHMLGRASTLLSLVSVAAIPLMQTGFGGILDLAAAFGLTPAAGYRIAFAAIAGAILLCAALYASGREADAQA